MSAETKSYLLPRWCIATRFVDAIALADDNDFLTIVSNLSSVVTTETNCRSVMDSAVLMFSITMDITASSTLGIININTDIDGSEDTGNQLVIPAATAGQHKVVYDTPVPIAEGGILIFIIDSALAGGGGESATLRGLGATFQMQ